MNSINQKMDMIFLGNDLFLGEKVDNFLGKMENIKSEHNKQDNRVDRIEGKCDDLQEKLIGVDQKMDMLIQMLSKPPK